MTSVTMVFFEKTFRQTSHSFKHFFFCGRAKSINVKGIPDNSQIIFDGELMIFMTMTLGLSIGYLLIKSISS